MIHSIIRKILGDPNEKALKEISIVVDNINSFESTISKLSDKDLKNKTAEFRDKLEKGENEDDILPEAFAVVREAAKRVLGERHYDVQLIGGINLHRGNISEMKTGEGKTLVATLPVYLNALSGKGVHVITVNDYLAKRDSEWMSVVYNFLDLECKYIIHGITNEERRDAYQADITYGTNNEFGFDYLRDNMASSKEQLVQRGLSFCIVDEVDSILIDEARTPLVISAPDEQSTSKYKKYASLIPRLIKDEDYEVDEKMRSVILTEKGIDKIEGLLGMNNIYSEAGFGEVHHIEQALKAHAMFYNDKDYVVKDNEVIIVDEFTGRLMPGRRFGDGLHQAIEAKENVTIRRESKTLATITFQNFFRLYDKLSGMTGTAATEAEEFNSIYELDVLIVPTNKPIARKDIPDAIFKNERGKFSAIIDKIQEIHETGQPILVGTISIEKSEELSKLLSRKKIPHKVLNAKHHEKEAEIVKNAGQFGSITIATNMAGRGTDIKLDDRTKKLGGLYILGTERHESRRIDNQLRGRAGRQGDEGTSQFFISMEDNLPKLFGSDKIKNMMSTLGIPDDMPIENKLVSRAIENAQKRVEGHNFDTRKHVLQYDDVLNKQRRAIYSKRKNILSSESIHKDILELIKEEASEMVNSNIDPDTSKPNTDLINKVFYQMAGKDLENISNTLNIEELTTLIENQGIELYELKRKECPDQDKFYLIERHVYLRAIDSLWMDHLNAMTHLRDEVALQGYGQRDPLQMYQQESYNMFISLLSRIQINTIATLMHISFSIEEKIRTKPANTVYTNKNEIADSSSGSKSLLQPTAAEQFHASTNISNNIQKVKVSRNEPCPCGSGKKYKKCCGKN